MTLILKQYSLCYEINAVWSPIMLCDNTLLQQYQTKVLPHNLLWATSYKTGIS